MASIGEKLNRISVVVFSALILLIAACSHPSIEFTGYDGPQTYFGLDVTFPAKGMGAYATSPLEMRFERGPLVVTIKRLNDGTFEIYRHEKLLGTAVKGDHVRFDDDGYMTVEKPTQTGRDDE